MDDLLFKYFDGDLTPDEQDRLFRTISSDNSVRDQFNAMVQMEKAYPVLAKAHNTSPDFDRALFNKLGYTLLDGEDKRKSRRFFGWLFPAIFGLALIVSVLFYFTKSVNSSLSGHQVASDELSNKTSEIRNSQSKELSDNAALTSNSATINNDAELHNNVQVNKKDYIIHAENKNNGITNNENNAIINSKSKALADGAASQAKNNSIAASNNNVASASSDNAAATENNTSAPGADDSAQETGNNSIAKNIPEVLHSNYENENALFAGNAPAEQPFIENYNWGSLPQDRYEKSITDYLALEGRYSLSKLYPDPTIEPDEFSKFNNTALTLIFRWLPELELGFDVRQETFFMINQGYENDDILWTYHQQANFTTFGLLTRFKPISLGRFNPFVQAGIGANRFSGIVRGGIGTEVKITDDLYFITGFDYSNMIYRYQNTWYFNTSRSAFNGGMKYVF